MGRVHQTRDICWRRRTQLTAALACAAAFYLGLLTPAAPPADPSIEGVVTSPATPRLASVER